MAPDEGDEDPAVYRSGSKKSKATNGDATQDTDVMDGQEEGEVEMGEDDATLLTKPANFNQLLIVLRDEGVLRFVKYVSAQANGSRWDISGEYEIDKVELEDAGAMPDDVNDAVVDFTEESFDAAAAAEEEEFAKRFDAEPEAVVANID